MNLSRPKTGYLPLETERLILRRWGERDRDLFHLINSDEQVMRFFPFRRNRKDSDRVMEIFNQLIAKNGICFAAIELKATGECLGMAGLHKVDLPEIFPQGTVEIGWRLAPEHWGNGYVTEAGIRLLDYGFNTLKMKEIVSFAVHNNAASIAVMRRLGMAADPASDYDHPSVPDTRSQLKRHVVYRITASDWKQKRRPESRPFR